jgi:hypothetical protein
MDIENLKFGLDTFGDTQQDDAGNPISAAQTIRNVVDQAVLADELGLDYFSVGEHHRDDFAVSSPDTVLAGIATRTKNIILGTGVTVQLLMPFQTDALKLRPVEDRSLSRSHYSVMNSKITESCLRRN